MLGTHSTVREQNLILSSGDELCPTPGRRCHRAPRTPVPSVLTHLPDLAPTLSASVTGSHLTLPATNR